MMQFESLYQLLVIITPILIGGVLGGFITQAILQLRNDLIQLFISVCGTGIGGFLGWLFDLAVVIPFLMASLG